MRDMKADRFAGLFGWVKYYNYFIPLSFWVGSMLT